MVARSFKKTPKTGNTKRESEKEDKQLANRKFRRISKQKLHENKILPEKIYEVDEIWSHGKDGKRWFNPNKYPKLMRK